MKRRCDDCSENEAVYKVITNGYDITTKELPGRVFCDGALVENQQWQIRTKRETTSHMLCGSCLLNHLDGPGCLYHMVYRLGVSSIPDGHDFDDLFRETLVRLAKFRGKTPAEFMRLGIADQLKDQNWIVADE